MNIRKNFQSTWPDARWESFAKRHSGCEFLQCDPLYALTEDVITAIQKEIVGFFTKEQEEFERDLARTTTLGYSMKQPLGNPAPKLSGGQMPIESLSKTKGKAAPEIKTDFGASIINPELRGIFRDARDKVRATTPESTRRIEEIRKREKEESALRRRRQEAFVGWLILNPTFQKTVSHLRSEWAAEIARVGRFPVRLGTDSLHGIEEPNEGFLRNCVSDFDQVLQHWNLEKLLTWELPLPLDIGHSGGIGSKLNHQDGVNIFLPWNMLHGQQIDLSEMIRRLAFEKIPAHMDEWVNVMGRMSKRHNKEIELQNMFTVYRITELVLNRRYRSKVHGNLGRIDCVIAEVINRDSESVRKTREKLNKSLKMD